MTSRLSILPKRHSAVFVLLLCATTVHAKDVLWRGVNTSSLNLLDGSGGPGRNPRPPFTFVKEDLSGSNPKITVTDSRGVKWKVKFGAEAQPETAAARIVWAAGYVTDEDYYLSDFRVAKLPGHLKRADKFVGPNGSMHDGRFERDIKRPGAEEVWKWKHNPFVGTREFNGLRVVMALINNWDLKDENNGVYLERGNRVYVVTDLGASFGPSHIVPGLSKSRGNLEGYARSHFIRKAEADFVDFADPGRPTILEVVNPPQYVMRTHLRWIGDHIPRSDARWMGQVLGRLSSRQIRDAFLAAGYPRAEADEFARVVEVRIADLRGL